MLVYGGGIKKGIYGICGRVSRSRDIWNVTNLIFLLLFFILIFFFVRTISFYSIRLMRTGVGVKIGEYLAIYKYFKIIIDHIERAAQIKKTMMIDYNMFLTNTHHMVSWRLMSYNRNNP